MSNYVEPISRTGVENVKLGACQIFFGGHSLGLTKGGVEVEVTTETKVVKLDQFGETTLSERITGRNVVVKVPMAETDIRKLSRVMPGSKLGEMTDDVADDSLQVYVSQGKDLHADAQTLELIPFGENDYKVTIHRANTNGSMTFAFKHDEERVFELTFNAYPDNSGLMMTLGDIKGVTDNTPPTVDNIKVTTGSVNEPVSVTAVATDANTADTIKFKWELLSQPSPTDEAIVLTTSGGDNGTVTFTPPSVGKYILRVVANDGVADSYPVDAIVTADTGNNVKPVMTAIADTNGVVGSPVAITATATDADTSDILTFDWTIGTKPTGATDPVLTFSGDGDKTATFSPDTAGEYTLTVKANDGIQDSVAVTAKIVVTAAAKRKL